LVPAVPLSYRDVEELLAERGIQVDHVTVYHWVVRFTPRPTRATERPVPLARTQPLLAGGDLGQVLDGRAA
jgi:transposase-like protein